MGRASWPATSNTPRRLIMGETFTHYARRVAARLDRTRLTVEQARAEVRPLLAETGKATDDPR